jgi:hypothetical protein
VTTHHLLPTVAELRASKPHLRPVVSVRDSTGTERVVYALQPKQWEAFCLTPLMREPGDTGAVHIGFGGAAGGGKSYLVRAIATAVAFRWPLSRTLILRETDGDVKRNHYQPLRFELGEVPGIRWNESELTVLFPNGSVIECGYLRHEKDFHRYQGNEYQCIIPEEATLLPPALVQLLVSSRLRGGPPEARPFALYPSNPGGQGHGWYKRVFVQRRYRGAERAKDYAFVQALVTDNVELMRRTPEYLRKLDGLPEPYRSWQRDGNFAAGAGSAFSMIDWRRHLVKPFPGPIPDYWLQFGSFDWGYRHPFAFGRYAVNEDGTIFKMETVTGIRLLPHEIAARIKASVPVAKLKYVVAGHDVKQKREAWGDNTPTIKEQFAAAGILLSDANIDRKQGLNELRKYLDWTVSGPIIKGRPSAGDPQLLFIDTPNNRRCLEQLENMVEDPTDPEDVLKVNADDFGEGGDDLYDETRYAVASRPITPRSPWRDESVSWQDGLEAEALAQHKSRPHRGGKGPGPEAVT